MKDEFRVIIEEGSDLEKLRVGPIDELFHPDNIFDEI